MGFFVDLFLKAVSFFKYFKPKTFEYGLFPQTIKGEKIKVEARGGECDYFIGDDGERYVEQTVICKRSVTFSNGQKFINGDKAYFKLEPVKWEIGNAFYERIEIKDNRGNVRKIKHKKTDDALCVSQLVLDKKSNANQKIKLLPDEQIFGDSEIKEIDSVANFCGCYSVGWQYGRSVRRNRIRKISDYAMARGVTSKKGKAYHSVMENNIGIAPSGKIKNFPKATVSGKTLYFIANPRKIS